MTTAIGLILVVFSVAEIHAQPKAAPDPWFGRSSKARDFYPAKLPWKIFTIELPDDWQIVPGFASTLLTIAEKGSGNQPAGAIVIEHTSNVLPLGPNDVDARLARNEADFMASRDPGATKFASEAKDVNNRRFVLIQYSRPGLFGPDHVAVYVFPAGKAMYRLICITPEAQLASKYQAICAHVASSFNPVTDTAK